MRIMLTGHRGFIGSTLLQRLKKNNQVIGFDLKDGWDRDKLTNSQDLFDCDLKEEFDLIIHLAGKSGVRQSMNDPGGYWINNVEVSKRLFQKYSHVRVLYASSSSQYEPHLNPYAASKHIMEKVASYYPMNLGMRFHTVYDDNPREGMFFDKLKKGTAGPYGEIELMTPKQAARKILSIVEEVLMIDKKEPISKSYRLYGTKVPAELVQELVRDE